MCYTGLSSTGGSFMTTQYVLITGTSRGIGLATAELFLAKGYTVIGTSTSGSHTISHPHFIGESLDLSKAGSIDALLSRLKNFSFSHLINNAAVLLNEFTTDSINIDQLHATMSVNVYGTIQLTEGLIPLLKQHGSIVNISSQWGAFNVDHFTTNAPHYKMSKSALNQYTLLLAERLKDRHAVSAISPGWVKTDMGTDQAAREPKEAALDIYNLATDAHRPSGKFWFDNAIIDW